MSDLAGQIKRFTVSVDRFYSNPDVQEILIAYPTPSPLVERHDVGGVLTPGWAVMIGFGGDIVETGHQLAHALAEAGHDAAGVLNFAGRLRTAGPATALAIWPEVRARLESLMIEERQARGHLAEQPPCEPLTDDQERVFRLIVERGTITGKQICDEIGIDQSVLTSRIIPALKRLRGIENKRGAGYYSPAHYKAE